MKVKKQYLLWRSIPLLVGLAGIVVGWGYKILSKLNGVACASRSSLTFDKDYNCVLGTLGSSIFILSLSLFIVSLAMFSARTRIYKIWLYFTIPFFLLTAYLVSISPNLNDSFLPLDKNLVSFLLSASFVFLSLLLFGILSLYYRHKEKTTGK